MPPVIWRSQSGCLLPFLIFFNFVFGRAIFKSTSLWLAVEGVLILIFIIQIYILFYIVRKQISSASIKGSFEGRRDYSKTVDIEGEVIEENNKPDEHPGE